MRWLGEQGIVDKVWHRNTFSAHKNEHMTTDFEKQRMAAALKLRKQQRTIRVDTTDLAALVRDNVISRVAEGELEPTIAEGLRAQEMLDRRVEKQGDRDMMLQLAGLLSGATPPVALLMDGNTIEGEFRDVEADEDEATFAALLPTG